MIFLLSLLGLALGSFINALVWRLYEQSRQKKPRAELSVLRGRSMCVNCKHQLVWYDLIPVVSWISLRGKCRYCHKSISWQYPLVEITTASLLVISYFWWPFGLVTVPEILLFSSWILITVLLVALAVYDLRWMLLPNRLMYPFGVGVGIFVAVFAWIAGADTIFSSTIGALLLGGFFYSLYIISKGQWIGGGDVRYGIIMGFLLGWQQMIVGLMTAAYAGTLLVIVLVFLGKYHKKMRVPFGPFLILGTIVAVLWGQAVVDWYRQLSGL